MGTHHSIRFLLAASMLFAGVPAWQHSHAGGDQAHSHAHDHHHHHGAGESHAHLHVTLFGVEFTLPVESEDDDSQEEQTTFLVTAPTVVDAVHTSHFAAMDQPILDSGEPVQVVPTFRCITDCAASLSSNAHLEHSCVLLI